MNGVFPYLVLYPLSMTNTLNQNEKRVISYLLKREAVKCEQTNKRGEYLDITHAKYLRRLADKVEGL